MSLLLRKFHSSCIVLLCFSLHSTMSLLLLCRSEYVKALTVLYIPLCLYYYGTFSALWQLLSSFTFHYVSITTRTSQSPTLQSQFYHFLSTLSFSLLIEYKYQQYRKKISYFYSKIAYLSTSHVFCFITGRQL